MGIAIYKKMRHSNVFRRLLIEFRRHGKRWTLVGTMLVFWSMLGLLYIQLPGKSMKAAGVALRGRSGLEIAQASLRDRLGYVFPYDASSSFPKTVWQTWKCDINQPRCDYQFKGAHYTWEHENKDGWEFKVVSDEKSELFVRKTFKAIPEVYEAWRAMPETILKADFFRYLVLFSQGGVYSDMDTSCLKPVKRWAPFNQKMMNDIYGHPVLVDNTHYLTPVGITIAIESSKQRPDWYKWYDRQTQFVQWTIMAKRGHPLLLEVIARIVEETARKVRAGKASVEVHEHATRVMNIMEWTGPGIFTDTVFDYLNNVMSDGRLGSGYGIGSNYWLNHRLYEKDVAEMADDGMPLHADQQVVNWKQFVDLNTPVMIDDVMVLPLVSFSSGTGPGSGTPEDALAYAHHLFGGSWKTEEGMQG